MSDKFNFEEAVKAIQSGQDITGKDGVLTPLIKQLTEAALEGEMDVSDPSTTWLNERFKFETISAPNHGAQHVRTSTPPKPSAVALVH